MEIIRMIILKCYLSYCSNVSPHSCSSLENLASLACRRSLETAASLSRRFLETSASLFRCSLESAASLSWTQSSNSGGSDFVGLRATAAAGCLAPAPAAAAAPADRKFFLSDCTIPPSPPCLPIPSSPQKIPFCHFRTACSVPIPNKLFARIQLRKPGPCQKKNSREFGNPTCQFSAHAWHCLL